MNRLRYTLDNKKIVPKNDKLHLINELGAKNIDRPILFRMGKRLNCLKGIKLLAETWAPRLHL